MSAAEVEEIFELRLKLEPDAAAEACLVADEARQDEALQVLAQLNAAAAGGCRRSAL
ncbi:hypothetical protein V8F63_05710 [Brevundimonas sp. LF-1]|uniref:hypothetical protein n=1 Tax=Brevundimonas sp. LF-1 TaxID=3126100 RepID=UPI0030DF2FDF